MFTRSRGQASLRSVITGAAGSGSGGMQVGYATSPDGSTWTKHADNPVMDAGAAGAFDDLWVMPRTVLIEDGLYRMWYGSAKDTWPGSGDDWRVGYAESEDGLSWDRHPEPVLERFLLAIDLSWDSPMGRQVLQEFLRRLQQRVSRSDRPATGKSQMAG